jgi:hypothetical protein
MNRLQKKHLAIQDDLLTAHGKIPFESLTVAQLVNKFDTFHENVIYLLSRTPPASLDPTKIPS